MRLAWNRWTAAAVVAMSLVGSAQAQLGFNGYFRYLGDSPSAAEPDWSNDAQGLAHDDNNWFITNNDGELWKIPLSQNLCCSEADDAGTIVLHIGSVPELTGFMQFKDPVARPHNGVWYLFVPMTRGDLPMAVAVFRADNMQYLDHQVFVNENGPPAGGNMLPSWCAISAGGTLFLPYQFAGFVSGVIEYTIDWAALSGPAHQFVASYVRATPLLSEEGNLLYFQNPQGGEFSLDGALLYTVTGYLDDSEAEQASEGVHAFDTTTWRRVRKSQNGSGLFNFQWIPGTLDAEEPQGITMWDLDGRGAPGHGGQMHVIMLDNDLGPDDIYLKHYTNRIWVNGALPSGNGTMQLPFRTVTEAGGLSWNGCEVRISAGLYDESVMFNRKVKLVSQGGTVRIGG